MLPTIMSPPAIKDFSGISFPTNERAVPVTFAAAQSSRLLVRAFADVFLEGPTRRPIPNRPHRKVRQQERGDVFEAMAILGLSNIRTVEAMAARGEIPGAAKIGRRWTFDLKVLREFVKQKERKTWQRNERPLPGATGGKVSSGAVSGSAGGTSDGRFTRITRQLRGSGGKREKRGP